MPNERRAQPRQKNNFCREGCSPTIQTQVEMNNVLARILSFRLAEITDRMLRMSRAATTTSKFWLQAQNSHQILRFISSK